MINVPPALNLILIEDDKDDSTFFEESLSSLNIPYNLTVATDCLELFKLLEDNYIFDIIFLDLNISLINGKECLKQLKAHERYKNIPVVIITGSISKVDIDETFQNGAHFYIVKPYAHINFAASLKIVLGMQWKENLLPAPIEKFVVNFTFQE